MRELALALGFAAMCRAETPMAIRKQMQRLAEEASAFLNIAPKVIGEEKLESIVAGAQARFQPRGGKAKQAGNTRTIVSEYGFSTYKEDPGNLHEVRQVLTVDGAQVKARGKLRETLSMGSRGDADKLKKKMLQEFQSFGLREAATDFGQILLMFVPRGQPSFDFAPLRYEYFGAERAMIASYKQKNGPAAMTVFEGRQVHRQTMSGEIWLREPDGLPLRVTVDILRKEDNRETRYTAVIDYAMSSYGCVLPAFVSYKEISSGKQVVENRFHYSNFKMFGASSDLKFTVDEPTKK
ncbi:MAG: hypothetical protein HYZ37_09030 [Candidatus Solibacter usitatus]|nr:hypothetical protein [Candidatus Solibacter usitatus]